MVGLPAEDDAGRGTGVWVIGLRACRARRAEEEEQGRGEVLTRVVGDDVDVGKGERQGGRGVRVGAQRRPRGERACVYRTEEEEGEADQRTHASVRGEGDRLFALGQEREQRF